METDTIKLLENTFVDHLTDTLLGKLIPQMKSGIPSMGIPPLDPLRLKPIKVEPKIGNDLFTIHLNDIETSGMSNVEIQDLKPKLNALKVRVSLLFPELTTDCQFSVNGSIYKMINVQGEGHAKLIYSDVMFRTQMSLDFTNQTLQIQNSDPPLVDFSTASIKLFQNGNSNVTSEIGMASEFGPLLFWVLADHIVQEVDDYLLKHINTHMLNFKVPEDFNPLVTWFMNRSGSVGGSSSFGNGHFPGNGPHMMPPFGRFSPLPLLNHWITSLSGFRPQPNPMLANRFAHK